jgi:hypothetical protein
VMLEADGIPAPEASQWGTSTWRLPSLGLNGMTHCHTCFTANDSGKYDFIAIANAIEKHAEGV